MVNTPLAIFEKCESGLSPLRINAIGEGNDPRIKSRPKDIRMPLSTKPNINAITWFCVELLVNIPIETKDAIKKIEPRYCAIKAPISRFAAVESRIGIKIVNNKPIHTNYTPEKNFPKITFNPGIG